jgi:hypothetical protein
LMFSPEAFSGYGFGSGAPSADSSGGPGSSQATGPQTISAEQAAANVALAQALTGGGLSQADIAEQQDYNDAVQAQEFNSMRDAEAGRLHADSLLGLPIGPAMMRNAGGRAMPAQTVLANLPYGAGMVARGVMTNNTLEDGGPPSYRGGPTPQDYSMEGLPGGDPRTIEQRLAARRRMEEALAGPQQPGI